MGEKSINIFIANNAEALSSVCPDATVEAEYGENVVIGKILTLAHHGPRAGRPCPCSIPNLPDMGIRTIGISHVDLDTVGGILAIMGEKPDEYEWVKKFWGVAAEIDIKGVHKLPRIDLGGAAGNYILDSLNAYWAFSQTPEGRIYPPKDGSVVDVSLERHFDVVKTLLVPEREPCRDEIDDQETWWSEKRSALVAAGRKWAEEKKSLEKKSFVEEFDGGVLFRVADQFVNHLYNHQDTVFKAIVGFNVKTKSITISLADPIPGFSCAEFAQSLWGPGAGGRANIAGSPRGEEKTLEDARKAAVAMGKAFAALARQKNTALFCTPALHP
jgi:hypothetical protein